MKVMKYGSGSRGEFLGDGERDWNRVLAKE